MSLNLIVFNVLKKSLTKKKINNNTLLITKRTQSCVSVFGWFWNGSAFKLLFLIMVNFC